MKEMYNTTEHAEKKGERRVLYSKKRCTLTACLCAAFFIFFAAARVFLVSDEDMRLLGIVLDIFAGLILLFTLCLFFILRREFLIKADKEGIYYWRGFHLKFFPWEWLSDYTVSYYNSYPYLMLYYNEAGLEENNGVSYRKGKCRKISATISIYFAEDQNNVRSCIEETDPHPGRKITALEQEMRQRSERKRKTVTRIFIAAFVLFAIRDCIKENDDFFVFGKTFTFIAVIIVAALFQLVVIAVTRVVWEHAGIRALPAFIITNSIVWGLCMLALTGIGHLDHIDDIILREMLYDVFVNFNFIPTKRGLTNMEVMFILEPAIYCFMTGSIGEAFSRTKGGKKGMTAATIIVSVLLMILSFVFFINCIDG